MGYNSSGLNIVLERLLLATRRPSTHYPLASGAAFFDPLRAICRRSAQHLATPCTASAISLRAILWPLRRIRRLSACHLPASSPRDTRQPIANHPPSRCAPSAGTLQAICWHEPMPLMVRRTNRRRKQEP